MIYRNTGSLRDLKETVDRVVAELRPHFKKGEWSAIVVTGTSGILVGGPVSLRLKVPLVIIRKPIEHVSSEAGGTHSCRPIEGLLDLAERNLFLDDCVSSGKTRDFVAGAVHAYGKNVVAMYLYETLREGRKTGDRVWGQYHKGSYRPFAGGMRWQSGPAPVTVDNVLEEGVPF